MVDRRVLAHDLGREQDALAAILRRLSSDDWARQTPAPGWTVAHQIAHLTFFEQAVQRAVTDPAEFTRWRTEQVDPDPVGFGERALLPYLAMTHAELLRSWEATAAATRQVLGDAAPGTRIPWFGPSMSVASKITARLMETWAHGQDVVDSSGIPRPATDALRHIADLAVRARPYSYTNRGLPVPSTPIRVELALPSGDGWVSGPPDANDVVVGGAEEFCLVLTRRRAVADTTLLASPGTAAEWLKIGQAYAGDPGPGRSPGQFRLPSCSDRAATMSAGGGQ